MGEVNVQDTGWQVLGEVGIDSGLLALVDPANGDLLQPGEDFGLVHRLVSEFGVPVGIIIQTGMGDGVYPVEGRVENVDGVSRIAEIRIKFLPHPVIGYDLWD